MRNPVLQKTLLILALALGQWLGFAHGFKHSGPAATDTVCEMCVAAHGLDDALPTSEPPRFEPAASLEAPVIAAFVSTGSQARVDPPIRGPPVLAA